jgi:hypothetical protein
MRSDQEITLGRCPARVSRIGRLRMASEVLQYLLNDRRILDTGDHPQLPAAAPAGMLGEERVKVAALVASTSSAACPLGAGLVLRVQWK